MPRQIVSAARRQRSRSATIHALIYAGIALIVLLIVGVIIWWRLAMATPAPPAIASASDAGSQVPTVPVEEQLTAARNAVMAGPGQPVALELTARDVTQRLSQSLAEAGITDAHVYLAEGKVAAQGIVTRGKRKVHVTIEAVPKVVDGTIAVDVTSARLGRAKMPDRLRKELQKGVDRALRANPPTKTGVAWDSVTIANGHILLRGRSTTVR